MATSDVTALQHSDLNEFLYAEVGPEPSGMMLRVVSLFARQGNDPWREADRLAGLPKTVATDSLARSIVAMPQGRWNLSDAAVIAARLIGLLPPRPAKALRRPATQATNWLPALPSTRNAIVLACVVLAVVCAVAAMTRSSPPSVDGGAVASFTAPAPGHAPATVTPGSH